MAYFRMVLCGCTTTPQITGGSIQGSETTLDNVKAFKFDVTTSSLGQSDGTNDIADLYGTANTARSNASNVRSIGAVSKCTIDIDYGRK